MPALPLLPVRRRIPLSPRLRCFALVAPLVAFSATAVLGQLPTARLSAIYPPGAQRGTEVEVTITGSDLEGVDRLHFSDPAITAAPKMQVVDGQPSQPIPNVFVVKVAAEVPVGLYECRAIGSYGITNPRAFSVGDRAEVAEVEPNNALTQATEVPLGTTINGRCDPARDIDCFRFTASRGQRIVLDLWGERIDSQIDSGLELYDANGRQLAIDRDSYGRDSFCEFAVPTDGSYVVKIYDFQYAGGPEHIYRLSIGATPHIDFVFPPAALPGSQGTFTLFGRNLPGSAPAEGVTLAGRPLEQLSVKIAVPSEGDRLTSDARVASIGAFLDGMNYRLSTPQGSSNPVVIGCATAPVMVEQEPNDLAAQAQKIEAPVEVAGQFGTIGDVDWTQFQAEEKEVYRIEVISARLGWPTDAWIAIEQVTLVEGKEQTKEIQAEDDTNENIGGLSFVTASADAAVRFVAPATATYRIKLRDLYYETRGDPRLIYRLSIRKEQPDFRLVVLPEFPAAGTQNPGPWTTLVRKGGTDALTLLAQRVDGFNGEIDVQVEGLPPGVTCPGGVIGPGQTRGTLVLAAAEGAADWAGGIRVIGKGKAGDRGIAHEARPGTIVQAATNRPAPARLARDLTLAVAQQAPLFVEATTPEVSLVQGNQLAVPLKSTRRTETKGPLNLTAAGLPVNVQNESVALAPDASEATLNLFVQHNVPPGSYMFYVQSTAVVPFTKNADGKDKKDITVIEASTPVRLTILPGPLVLDPHVPNKGVIKRGASLEIPVTITRRNNFAGPVVLDIWVPQGVSGVQCPAITLPPDQSEGKLVLSAGADATEGAHARATVRAKVEIDGKPLEVQQPIPLEVQQ